MGNQNFNKICGKLLKDARLAKNLQIEDIALYLLPKKEEKTFQENNELNEIDIDIDEKVKMSYLRKQMFQNAEIERMYEDNIKKINYWEKGNGFPELNEIYKLAEIIDINPNEIYKYRELGRKNLKGEKSMSGWKYYRNRIIDDNLESLKLLFPALVGAIIFWFLFSKNGAEIVHGIISSISQIFTGTHN